ncbi:MAG TPA: GGDEF domain-containing protein [Thermoleophilaceae bacterium]|nr:GGDEF domain-containing protein [Thermoleophilaceae bacterium]
MDGQRLSAVLVEFARTLVTSYSIQEILDHLVDRVVHILPVTGSGVMLMGGDRELHFAAASDETILRIEGLQMEFGEGPCLAAYETGDCVLVGDLARDGRFERFGPHAVDAGLAAVFSFPLLVEGRSLGALDLYSDVPVELATDEVDAAVVLADVAAIYLFNAQARTEAEANADDLRRRALHDPLTGLPNRELVHDRLEHALAKTSRSSAEVAVLFVDLDRFKAVNDNFGHHVGDKLLIAIAERLSAVLRPGDTLGRLSGDEFVVVCEELPAPTVAGEVADRIVDAMSRPFSLGANELSIAASVGVATARDGLAATTSADELLRNADAAMYLAKRRGGNQRTTASDLTRADTERRTGIDRDLAHAIERDELHLEYQPIVSAATSSWSSVEALLRWNHPTAGAVPPESILASAERTGLSGELSEWVVRRACEDMRRWEDQTSAPPESFAVNVSARELMHPDHCRAVAKALSDAALPAESLCIEITESVLVEDVRGALAALGALKNLGVGLALDDFGTGYSSLNYLKAFPVDVIKIDRSFVANLGDDPIDETIIEAVVKLARALELSVIAEGVEDARQLDRVRALRCDHVQGYLFSRPLPAAAIASHRFARASPAAATR